MSTAQYEIYQRKVFDLAHTLVVKSGATANAINTSLSARGVAVNDNDPTTWKYYLNLNGRYHATDERMSVRSLDTLQTIPFTRESLALHRATAREYAFGSEYYNELVKRYPANEILIRCILNPIDLQTALAAPDGTILYYDKALVEENETNLIEQLNTWSVNMFARWNVNAYGIVDELYPAAYLGVYFAQLPAAIMNIRLHNCHTIYAHSFHILEYLAGQGRLDVYADALTRKQLLWLYRNIRWIHRNTGKNSTMKLLMDRLLTERGFPLAAWTMRHNTADMLDEVYPDIEFSRETLNIRSMGAGSDTISVAEMLEKEIPAARNNHKNLDEVETETTRLMERAPGNHLQTKVLESAILDTTDAYPYTLADALVNNWVFLSQRSRYVSTITVTNPRSGSRMSINVKDAFILYVYLWARSRRHELPHLPRFKANMIRKAVTPSRAELDALVPRDLPPAVTDRLIELAPPLYPQYISTEAFYRSVSEVFDGLLNQRHVWGSMHDYRHRAWAEIQALYFYEDHEIDCGEHISYADWLHERGMDFSEYTRAECELLADTLLKTGTGADLRITMSLKDLQAAMLKMMAQLSSYTVQFIQTINSDPIKVIDWRAVSPTRPFTDGAHETETNVVRVRPMRLRSQGLLNRHIDIGELGSNFSIGASAEERTYWDIGLDITQREVPTVLHRVSIARVDFLDQTIIPNALEDVTDRDTENYIPLERQPLASAFTHLSTPEYVLSDDDRARLRDRWLSRPPLAIIDPNYVIWERDLDGIVDPVLRLAPDIDGLYDPTAPTFPDLELPHPMTPVDEPTDVHEAVAEQLPPPMPFAFYMGRLTPFSMDIGYNPFLNGLPDPELLGGDLDGLTIPSPLGDTLDGFIPPSLLLDTLDGFVNYLDTRPDLDGLNEPLLLGGTLEGVPDPEAMGPSLDGFVDGQLMGSTLDGFIPPELALAAAMNGLGLPPLVGTYADGLEDPDKN